ncbi:MAG: oxidoreductase [Acidobacteriota bacterium]
MSHNKPKVAFYWCASCGGCEEAVVDLAEDILKITSAVDIVFWPVAMDFKRKDIEAMEDESIDVSFINGAVRLSEQEEMVKLLRKKSKLVVAFGSCSHLGGIPGLGNFWDKQAIFDYAYQKSPSTKNPGNTVPLKKSEFEGKELELPEFYDTVFSLNQVIDVDYYLPGCAPPKDVILDAVNAILEGKLPPKGSVLSPNKSLCDECDRNDSKPEKLAITEIKRPWEVDLDPEECFLAQGIICMGPATRAGCGQRCITANMPCRGCLGPTDQVFDQGAKFLSALASIIETNDEKEIDKLIDSIVDPAGTFYRFSLPASILRRKRMEATK